MSFVNDQEWLPRLSQMGCISVDAQATPYVDTSAGRLTHCEFRYGYDGKRTEQRDAELLDKLLTEIATAIAGRNGTIHWRERPQIEQQGRLVLMYARFCFEPKDIE